MVVYYLLVTKMDCCRVASCTFLIRYMIISIAKISIYSSGQVDVYFFRKNVEDIVLNEIWVFQIFPFHYPRQ